MISTWGATGGLKPASPLSWFSYGEQGTWYDPSDLTTLFQDSAGTTPVTAVEQPVGLMLDKSKGLVLGSELVTNGDFSQGTTGWSVASGSLVVNSGVATITNTSAAEASLTIQNLTPNSWFYISADISALNLTGTVYFVTPAGSNVSNIPRSGAGKLQGYFSSGTTGTGMRIAVGTTTLGASFSIDNISIKQLPGNHAFQATAGNRPTLSARVNLLLGSAALSTQTVTTQATQYVLTFTGTGTVALSGTFVLAAVSSGTYTFTATAGALIVTVVGSVTNADIRPTNIGANLPAYQRVNTSTDYDTTGFPLYLNCNGTSTAMATNSIDFSATDKLTMVAGIRKVSDSTPAILTELSANIVLNAGGFSFSAPETISGNYGFASRGSLVISPVVASGYAAPTSNVLTGQSAISTPLENIRVNGAQAATSSASQGTGNYGNYPLYLFARGGTSLWFNGYFYGLIVCGATRSTQQVQQVETYINLKEGGVY